MAEIHTGASLRPTKIELVQGWMGKQRWYAAKARQATKARFVDWTMLDGAPPLSIVITVCDSAAAETCPVFFGANGESGGQSVKVHWGYPDPSNAEGGEDGKRRAFELTRQAIGYRMLQLLALPLETMDDAALQQALDRIAVA